MTQPITGMAHTGTVGYTQTLYDTHRHYMAHTGTVLGTHRNYMAL